MEAVSQSFRLLIACPDRPGIIAAVSSLLARYGANVTAFDQHSEGPPDGMFFMRAAFDMPGDRALVKAVEDALKALATTYDMQWRLTAAARPHRLALFVSREDHCMNEILWQIRRGEILAEVAFVVSNHELLEPVARGFGVPFYYLPVSAETKSDSEQRQWELIVRHRVDTVVLARYMQILSPQFVSRMRHRIINIHHSFLPAFVGPRPYHQAFARGVKLIGATAHYVTEDLDAGPIIEQDVQRVDHRYQVSDFQRVGRHVERMVLARAVKWHVEERVLVYQNRTVVFPF
jgi:formyltetrahydrofolate deformylase